MDQLQVLEQVQQHAQHVQQVIIAQKVRQLQQHAEQATIQLQDQKIQEVQFVLFVQQEVTALLQQQKALKLQLVLQDLSVQSEQARYRLTRHIHAQPVIGEQQVSQQEQRVELELIILHLVKKQLLHA
jgi:hypothetical protein